MLHTALQTGTLDPSDWVAQLESSGAGAVASFTGIARSDDGVVAIELEHFPGMTEATLHALAGQASERFGLTGCVVIHRIGRIAVGETIVFVGAASRHRAEALAACAFLIDRLKVEAAFWKKEYLADGSSRWVDARNSDDARAKKWDG